MTRDINLLKQMSLCNEINLIHKSKIARKEKHLMFLKQDLEYKRIEEQLESSLLKQRIVNFENKIKNEICADLPNALWHRKQHIVSLPYESDFNERNIPTKARPIQMNQELFIIIMIIKMLGTMLFIFKMIGSSIHGSFILKNI
jgi:hypothetical protein